MSSRRTPKTSRSTCGATTWTPRWPTAGKASRCTSSGGHSGREHHRADDTRGLAHVVNAKEFHFFPAEEGDPPEPDPGINEEESGPGVLGRRDRSDSPAGDGPAAPGHITHGPAGRATATRPDFLIPNKEI